MGKSLSLAPPPPAPTFSGLHLKHGRNAKDWKSLHAATIFCLIVKTKPLRLCQPHFYLVFGNSVDGRCSLRLDWPGLVSRLRWLRWAAGPRPVAHPRGQRPSEEAKLLYWEVRSSVDPKLKCKLPSSKWRTLGQGRLIKAQFSEQRQFLNQLPHLSRTFSLFPRNSILTSGDAGTSSWNLAARLPAESPGGGGGAGGPGELTEQMRTVP